MISKTVKVEFEPEEIAQMICELYNDEQAEILLEIASVVSDNIVKAQSQICSIGEYIYDSMDEYERKIVKEFIKTLNDFIVDFEKNKESESNGNYECKDN